MSNHLDEIDRAVLLARRAALAGHIDDPRRLTRLLHHHWFLGRTSVPEQREQRARADEPWRTWGPLWTDDRSCRGDALVRLYLSCAPHTALHAVSAVQSSAAGWDHPWLLTSRALGQPVPRPDATVLYLPADAVEDLRSPLRRLVDDLQPFLASTVPALTLRIGRGASLAQNPADGRGYGEHRCSLIAGTVLANLRHHHREVTERTFEAFRRAGVDPRRPYRTIDARWEWQRLAAAA